MGVATRVAASPPRRRHPQTFEWRTLRSGQIEKLGTKECEPHRAPFHTWQLGYLVQTLYGFTTFWCGAASPACRWARRRRARR